jgi:malate synthase
MDSIRIEGPGSPAAERVLTREALDFVAELQRRVGLARADLLRQRVLRQEDFAHGVPLGFLDHTRSIRDTAWEVAPTPPDLEDRRVEITGPVERKMMINALNSGASAFMADFEDSLSPTWENVVAGQANLIDAVRRDLAFTSPEGKEYRLGEKTATLMVRPRGWHLIERHALLEDVPVSASLFDFGLFFFHNAAELGRRGTGPYFYLPKLESHVEAALWNQVFDIAQHLLGLPRGTVRATVLIETIGAAFEMDEILWELRDHAAGLNAGRWDYIFSIIRKLPAATGLLTDRFQVTMDAPFMRTYADLLVHTCHHRGAHAIGGMAAFIPSRKDEEVNRVALQKVREDKEREARQGFDGTWVAHPDLVPVAREVFDRVLDGRPNQKHVMRDDAVPSAATEDALIDFRIEGGKITEEGLRSNISIALQYLDSWLQGQGAAAIRNLMEDAATAEISRAQLWQWLHHDATLEDGRKVTPELYRDLRDQELQTLGGPEKGRLSQASEILDSLVLNHHFVPFLTTEAYRYLE